MGVGYVAGGEAGGLEGAHVGEAHGFAQDVDHCLVGDGLRGGEEEEAQGDVEEAPRSSQIGRASCRERV